MNLKKLCIYHGNCADGFGAAWVVRKALGADNVEFYAGTYQQEPPDVTDRDVIMVDFSYKRAVVDEMLKKCRSMVIIDHHKSAMEDLANIDIGKGCMVQACFDLNHSGAMLAWIFFNGDNEPPQLIRHIEDRDLWRFQLPGTREIQAALFSYPYDFEVWDRFMLGGVQLLKEEGAAIERKHFKDIAELLKVCQRELIIGGYKVPAASLPYTMSSDAGHMMSKDAPFAACYYDTSDGKRAFSLRSAEHGVDVSEVAKRYGGGGHKHAAGFSVSLDEAQTFELGSSWNLTQMIHDSLKLKEVGTYDLSARVHKKGEGDVRLSNMFLEKGKNDLTQCQNYFEKGQANG